jgi:hypothetical protein
MAEDTKTEDKKTDEKKKSSSDGKSSIKKKKDAAVSRSKKQREAVSKRAKEFNDDDSDNKKLTPKQKLQAKYKELIGEKPAGNMTMEKLEKGIKKAEKDNDGESDSTKKAKGKSNPNAHVRQSGKEDAPDTTATLEPLAHANPEDWLGSNRDPDVMLSVPNLGIDHIGLNVKNLYAHVDLNAQVLDLVKLHVGADVGIEEVDLQINNVRVQAMLKVKLEKVRDIVGDVVGFLDNNPEVLTNLTGGLGKGLEGALSGKRGGQNNLSDQIDNLSDEDKGKLRKMLKEKSEDKED